MRIDWLYEILYTSLYHALIETTLAAYSGLQSYRMFFSSTTGCDAESQIFKVMPGDALKVIFFNVHWS